MGKAAIESGSIQKTKRLQPSLTGKDLVSGTVRGIIRELGISREEFGPIK